VLRLLATELTGPQIARQLFVSVNTVRTHIKHIFTKLEVNTRRAAVRRGAQLDLLLALPCCDGVGACRAAPMTGVDLGSSPTESHQLVMCAHLAGS
jgi:Bacterial regulatory proteins, luxR family